MGGNLSAHSTRQQELRESELQIFWVREALPVICLWHKRTWKCSPFYSFLPTWHFFFRFCFPVTASFQCSLSNLAPPSSPPPPTPLPLPSSTSSFSSSPSLPPSLPLVFPSFPKCRGDWKNVTGTPHLFSPLFVNLQIPTPCAVSVAVCQVSGNLCLVKGEKKDERQKCSCKNCSVYGKSIPRTCFLWFCLFEHECARVYAFAAAVSYDEFDIRSSGVIKCCTVYARLCGNVVVCF